MLLTDGMHDKIDAMAKQISEIHAALFGVEGHGGLHRRMDNVETRLERMETWRNKSIGAASGVSAVLTLIGGKLFGLFK